MGLPRVKGLVRAEGPKRNWVSVAREGPPVGGGMDTGVRSSGIRRAEGWVEHRGESGMTSQTVSKTSCPASLWRRKHDAQCTGKPKPAVFKGTETGQQKVKPAVSSPRSPSLGIPEFLGH